MLLVSAGDGQVAELGCPNVPGEQSAVHSQALREAAPSPDRNLPFTGPGTPDSNRSELEELGQSEGTQKVGSNCPTTSGLNSS